MKGSWLSLSQLRKSRYGLTPLIVLTGLGFVSTFEGQIFTFAGPNIQSDLNLRLEVIIGLFAIVGVIGTVVAIPIAWWADRHRRTPLVGAGAILQGFGGLLMSRSVGRSSLSAGASIDAAGFQLNGIPQTALVADWYPIEMRGRAISLLVTIGRFGLLISGVLTSFMVFRFGWRSTFVIIEAALIAAGVVSLLVLRNPVRGYWERKAAGLSDEEALQEDEPLSLGESIRATFAVRTMRRLFVAYIVSSLGDTSFDLFVPFFLADVYGLNAFQRGLVVIPAVLAALVGGIGGGFLIDRLQASSPGAVLRLAASFGFVASFGLVVFAVAPPLPIAIAGYAFVSLGRGLLRPTTITVAAQVVPPRVRTLALNFLGLNVVPGAILVTLFGVIQQNLGYSPMFLLTLPFILLGSLLIITAADFFEGDLRNNILAAASVERWQRAKRAGEPAKLLTCEKVDAGYDGVQVLFGIDFELDAGEIVALLGTNGAGKSTLLRAISGTQEASGGAIILGGRDITHMPPHEIARRGIVQMPGGRGVFGGMTVRENLELGTWMERDAATARKRLDRIYQVFPVLQKRADEPAAALSGGEQQMLSLSQAFLAEPKILLIDELSLGLAPAVVAQLLEIVRQINDEGAAIVLVEQSVNVALTVAHRAVFLEKGEVKFAGPTRDLLRRPDLLRAVYVKGTAALGAGSDSIVAAAGRRAREAELAASSTVLEVRDVVKRFGGVAAVDHVSLELRQGEVLGLIGPNGSGKTTLIDIISGYVPADSGQIIYQGADITSLPAHARARRKLVRRFQDAKLYPSLTVYESLLVALDQRLEVRSSLLAAFGAPPAWRSERRAQAQANRLLELLSLNPYRDKFVRELSTGLRRILDLAVVLASEPKVLLLDEPSTGIAQAESEGLAPLIRRVRHETGCAILVVEHDIPLITAIADELVVLDQGKLLVRGPAATVLADERVVTAYLGASEAAIQRSGELVTA
jgi:ABC-type branched-subunit amino acid transport system ATPase component/MFS family permease